jgi:16S rRNA processing protein RimM
LRNSEIGVRKSEVAPLPEGTYYIFDLIGCEVVGSRSGVIGKVDDVLQMPANDVLVVETRKGEVLIPLVGNVIKGIDIAGKMISIEEIEGLLDV